MFVKKDFVTLSRSRTKPVEQRQVQTFGKAKDLVTSKKEQQKKTKNKKNKLEKNRKKTSKNRKKTAKTGKNKENRKTRKKKKKHSIFNRTKPDFFFQKSTF